MKNRNSQELPMEDVGEKLSIAARMRAAYAQGAEKRQQEARAAQAQSEPQAFVEAKYREKFAALCEAFAQELCAAAARGRSRLELGIWERPYQSMQRPSAPRFMALPERPISCLLPVFTEAACESAIEACVAAFKAFLGAECEGVSLVRHNLYARQAQAPVQPAWWPRCELFVLVFQLPSPKPSD